ncbi:hypothetical protein lerEdw1_016374 [Lerista edwardsae]|nr:hypothetical protein lerEdw1_016374 [Lerista edwardsae]
MEYKLHKLLLHCGNLSMYGLFVGALMPMQKFNRVFVYILILGVPSKGHKEDECGQYPEPAKGQATACTFEYRPVCGSDGVTYGNKCLFCIAKRESGGKITIKHKGTCEQKDECGQYQEPRKGQAPQCPRDYKPLCGSDGVTYPNKCYFCIAKKSSQ